MISNPSQAKSSSELFDLGFKKYLDSNCAEALDPLYQSSQSELATKDRALLYVAHCQSIFARNLDSAYNLDHVKSKNLARQEDQKLYKDLLAKHRADIETVRNLGKVAFNGVGYVGQGTTSPDSVKDTSEYYGLSLGASRPTWSVNAFYEGYTQKMTPETLSSYSQTMGGGQLGYFVLPSWRVSASYTSITGSIDQLKSVSVVGAQTDYYFMPYWSVFLEYYMSSYPKLLANSSSVYKYPVDANQYVAGVNFPIIPGEKSGLTGTASYSGISLKKSSDASAVIPDNLKEDTSRFELSLSGYMSQASAAITYWSGKEVLGVRGRGAIVMDSTDLRKSGAKVNVGYSLTKNLGLGGAYGTETYTSTNLSGEKTDFTSSSITGLIFVNW